MRTIFLLVSVGVASAVAQSSPALAVSGSRPLMKADDALESQLNIPINYEDPKLQYAADLQDVTDEVQNPQQRAANPNVRIVVPKRGQLSIAASLLPTQQASASDVMSLLTQFRMAHEAQNLPGRFTLVQRESMWTVEPSGSRSTTGEFVAASSVLNVHITFPFQSRNAVECLMLFVKAVNQGSPEKIDLGAYPIVALVNAPITCGAADEPANVVLPRMFNQVAAVHSAGVPSVMHSYRLLYDPQLRYYLLNVNSVATNNSNVVTATPAVKTDPQPTGFLLQKK